MNRRSFLERSLTSWISMNLFEKIIVVDWGCKEPLDDLIKIDGKIFIIKIPEVQFFDMGATKNVGARFSTSDLIAFVDCDLILNEMFRSFVKYELPERCEFAYTGTVECGTTIASKNVFTKTNGFLEGLPVWGWDDREFVNRVKSFGFKGALFPDGIYTHIYHSERIRHENFEMKTKRRMQIINKELIKSGAVNCATKQQIYKCTILNKNQKERIIMI
jgi:glycosyltransferase involved in cell wall biosynthesis